MFIIGAGRITTCLIDLSDEFSRAEPNLEGFLLNGTPRLFWG